jgi:hypothetical protein
LCSSVVTETSRQSSNNLIHQVTFDRVQTCNHFCNDSHLGSIGIAPLAHGWSSPS